MKNAFRPIPYGRTELLLARLLFAYTAWISFPGFTTFVEQPAPVGLAHWFDFTWLAHPDPVALGRTPLEWTRLALGVALLVYITGFFDLFTLPFMLFALVSIGTLNNSQGAITHSFQAIALIAVLQFGFALVRPGLRRKPRWDPPWLTRERWFLFISQQGLIAAYLVTAITKIHYSGFFGWISDARYFPLQLAKTDRMHYFNTLTGQDGQSGGWSNEIAASLQRLFLDSPAASMAIIGSGLVLEALAVLALLGRGWNLALGLLLITFHLTVSAAMNLTFKYNMLLLTAYFVIPPVVSLVRDWSAKTTRQVSARH